MNPNIWGPATWTFLHTITFTYPDNPTIDDKKNMYNFFMNLSNVLPCEKCKINFDDHLRDYPLTSEVLCSKSSLSRWLIDIHNEINKLNKKSVLSYQQVEDYYNRMYSGKNTCMYVGFYGIIIIFVILLIIAVYKLKK